MNPAFTLDGTYIHLRPDERALAMEGGAKFWQHIEERHDLDQARSCSSGPRASGSLMIVSAQDARGPEEHDHERAWRPALRQDMTGG